MYNNDFMAPDIDQYDIVDSDISLAVLQDSGWYRVDFKYSNPITWGFHQGCDFLEEKCVSNSQTLTDDFCTEENDSMCDYLGVRIGYCELVSYYTPLPLNISTFLTHIQADVTISWISVL